MRKTFFVVLVCLIVCGPGFGQGVVDSWQPVRQLSVGTTFYVKARSRHQTCKLASVDERQLTCQNGSKPPSVFQRDDIQSIKLRNRGVSSVVGLLVGAGTGALIGVASQSSCKSGCFVNTRAIAGVTGAVLGGVTGAVIGFATDLNRGPTVYKAP